MTKAEILKDTIDFYSQDPEKRRALNETGGCQYSTIDGRACAVGRKLSDHGKKIIQQSHINSVGVYSLAAEAPEKDLDNILVSECHGHGINFWNVIQSLHDMHHNWGSSGLSIEGILKVANICKEFEIDVSEVLTKEQIDLSLIES